LISIEKLVLKSKQKINTEKRKKKESNKVISMKKVYALYFPTFQKLIL